MLTNVQQYLTRMGTIRGEGDQRALALGHEYTDEDGDGMPDLGVDHGGNVVASGHHALPSDLDDAFNSGYQAAADGKSDSKKPSKNKDSWLRGWNQWHTDQASDKAA